MLENFETVGEWESDAEGNKVGLRRIDMESVMRHFTTFDGPVLHIGSKAADLDTTTRWRRVFAGKQVIGIDIEDGDNVDYVFDITKNISGLRKKTGIKQYSTIVAYHLLEHVTNPFEVAANIEKLLKPGGRLILSVPWVQAFHAYPDDFWRISFSGLRQLFKNLDFEFEFYADGHEGYAYQLTRNGIPEHSPRMCNLEARLFQLRFEMGDMPEQKILKKREDKKIQISKPFCQYMACSIVAVKR
ncbi:class I SAM-dependent methyltransferase [Terasakiella sp.]|uniref:class I SAM-dependent methyltransferase n=1 Tax=Terasakiella sp. TaxID=2034861 RepID=UPI003AA899E0